MKVGLRATLVALFGISAFSFALMDLAWAADDPDLTPQQRRERALAGSPSSDDDQAPGAVTSRAPAPSEAELWTASINTLPNGGWLYVGSMADEAGFFFASTHNVVHSGAIVTVWIRWEYRLEQSSSSYYMKYRSSVTREEVDCMRQAMRALTVSYYPQNNMDGTATSYSYENQKVTWDPSVPGTVGEYLSTWICNRFKANHSPSSAPH
jgi:hypothetical protein